MEILLLVLIFWQPKGLDDVEHRIFTERNNGVSVKMLVTIKLQVL